MKSLSARLISFQMRYNFQIEYISRKECGVSDTFSRAPMKIGFDDLDILEENLHELLTREDIEAQIKKWMSRLKLLLIM